MTSQSLPAVRRRFLVMLWLSAALHALVIGLTRLPSSPTVSLPPELEVRLAEPAPRTSAPAALPKPETVTPARAPQSLPPPQPISQPVAKTTVQPPPQPASPVPSLPAATPASTPPAATASHEAPGPQLSIPLVVDTRYYSAKELDSPPTPAQKPQPFYPPQADEQGISGYVVLRLHLEVDGQISKVEAIEASPGGIFGEMFKQSALDSTKNLRFRPARRNGQPVRALVDFKIVFDQDGKD